MCIRDRVVGVAAVDVRVGEQDAAGQIDGTYVEAKAARAAGRGRADLAAVEDEINGLADRIGCRSAIDESRAAEGVGAGPA